MDKSPGFNSRKKSIFLRIAVYYLLSILIGIIFLNHPVLTYAEAVEGGQCYQVSGFLGIGSCPNWNPGDCNFSTGCKKGKNTVFQCGGNGINIVSDTCCISDDENKSGEDIAFASNLDCGNYYNPGYRSGCRDNNKRYGKDENYCKNNKVMLCGADGNVSETQDCNESANSVTGLKYVCVEAEIKGTSDSSIQKAQCMADDQYGETCGDPASGNSRCCCINLETTTAGLNEDDQFGINRYITKASSMILGQVDKDAPTFKAMNRLQSACVSGYEPINNSVKLYDVFKEDGTVDESKINNNSKLVCSTSCRCEKDAAQMDASVLCKQYLNKSYMTAAQDKEIELCQKCFTPKEDGGSEGYWSALGCIKFSTWETFFQENIFPIALGAAGLIAFLCIIYSAIMIQTSAGNPEKIKKAQQSLTSCISGLIIIIFSVFILKLIGVDILRIPMNNLK